MQAGQVRKFQRCPVLATYAWNCTNRVWPVDELGTKTGVHV